MEKNINTIDLGFKEVNVKKSPYFKIVAILLMLIFVFNPLYELVDVFKREYIIGLCCMLPCPSAFSGYFFI